jgi:mannose-6-phosphate isomerase-like protein (cupin superfamily)
MALHKGEGWSVAHLGDLGEGPGFRKIRRELDVSEMGVNAIVQPSGIETSFHHHERQEEVYFVHRGAVEIAFGDGTTHRLEEGGLARVDAGTPRMVTTVGDENAVYVIFGAHGGYVGRDGVQSGDGAP